MVLYLNLVFFAGMNKSGKSLSSYDKNTVLVKFASDLRKHTGLPHRLNFYRAQGRLGSDSISDTRFP
ncbi:hypothetical protein GCM10011391_27000 [Pullulanibacillus camelliae]|uniref:Uncharacterized protein n=1 Tax=Pullulanibacillus camelliae TaxID=1707096 RepID=A0A8J3DWK4_9BACL|nr:hypothetical protein GCM10011391_27000 [Pullulanibacillus camelliae]